MILYQDCFPWTTNDREQDEGLGASCVAFFYKSELFTEFSTSKFTVWVGEQIWPYINFEMQNPDHFAIKNNLSVGDSFLTLDPSLCLTFLVSNCQN